MEKNKLRNSCCWKTTTVCRWIGWCSAANDGCSPLAVNKPLKDGSAYLVLILTISITGMTAKATNAYIVKAFM